MSRTGKTSLLTKLSLTLRNPPRPCKPGSGRSVWGGPLFSLLQNATLSYRSKSPAAPLSIPLSDLAPEWPQRLLRDSRIDARTRRQGKRLRLESPRASGQEITPASIYSLKMFFNRKGLIIDGLWADGHFSTTYSPCLKAAALATAASLKRCPDRNLNSSPRRAQPFDCARGRLCRYFLSWPY